MNKFGHGFVTNLLMRISIEVDRQLGILDADAGNYK